MSLPKEVAIRRKEADDPFNTDKDEILSWVCGLDMQQRQTETFAKRAEGTGDWILSAPEFSDWVTGRSSTSVLWCPGLPHTGKTILTSIVVDHLSNICIGANSALAYVYCEAKNPFSALSNENTALLLLSSICRQLASQSADVPLRLRKLYKQMTLENERPGIDEIMLVILSLCDSFEKVFICVDGPNLCDRDGEREIMMSKIQWMRNHSARIFVTSDIHNSIPEPCDCHDDISDAFGHDGRLVITAAEGDIRKCLLQRLRMDSSMVTRLSKSGLTPELVVEPIVAECGGMYLTAQLKLDRELRRLRMSSEDDSIKIANSSTMAAIEVDHRMQVWHQRLDNVQNQDKILSKVAFTALSWIVYAKEPLHIGQLAQVLARSLGGSYRSVDIPDILVEPQGMETNNAISLLETCKGLVAFCGEDDIACLSDDCVPELLSAQLEELFPNTKSWITRICLEFLGSDEVLASEERDDMHHEDVKKLRGAESFSSDEFLMTEKINTMYYEEENELLGAELLDLDDILPSQGKQWADSVSSDEVLATGESRNLHDEEVDELQRDEVLEFDKILPRKGPDSVLGADSVSSDEVLDRKRLEEVNRPQLAVPFRWHGFKRYAQRHWASHLLNCQDEALDACAVEYLRTMFARPARWLEEIRPYHGSPFTVWRVDDETPLLKAARFGLNRVLLKLLALQEYDIEARSWLGESAMSVAVAGGHISTVQLLYKNRAFVNEYRNQYGDTLLHMAAEKNDEIMVALLIYYGFVGKVDVKSPGKGDKTPLQMAVEHKGVRAAEMLLDYGADLYLQQNHDLGSMHKAIEGGDLEMVKLLVNRGYDLSSSSSLVFPAVETGSLQLVKYIAACGANLLELGHRGKSALHIAAHKGQLEMLMFLLEHGADPFARDEGYDDGVDYETDDIGSTALEKAMMAKHQDIIEILLPRLGSDVPKHIILGILQTAIWTKHLEMVTSLLDMVPGDLTFYRTGSCAQSLLGTAIASNEDDLINSLLDRGLSPALQDRFGYSPLHVAAIDHPTAAKILLDHGADINLRSKYGLTPVHVAACEGKIAALELFLQCSPDLSIRAEDGCTSLLAAMYCRKPGAVQLLLKCGAPVSLSNIDGESVIHLAILDGDDDLVRQLLELDIDNSILSRRGGSALHLAAFKGHIGIVEQLLDSGADLELSHQFLGEGYVCPRVHRVDYGVYWNKDDSGYGYRSRDWSRIEAQWKPLHSAACGGHSAVVDVLLQHGVNISSKGLQGETPLHVAASAAEVEILGMLLKAGADIFAVDNNGNTALHAAALASAAAAAEKAERRRRCNCERKNHSKECPPSLKKSSCVVMLLDHGADPTLENLQGLTPLAMAAGAGHEDVIRTLIDRNPSHPQANAAYVKLLRACIGGGNSKILKMISADVQESDDSLLAWQDLFHSVCQAGDLQMVSMALQAGAKPNEKAADGTYALHNAIAKEQDEVVDVLLGAGADFMVTDTLGRNALHIACSNILHCGKEKPPVLLVYPSDQKKERIANYLIYDGAPVNSRTADGDTALHFAVATGDEGLVSRLFSYGASPDVRNSKGFTPLHAAVSTFIFPNIVANLLDHGACPTAQDHSGRTPLHALHTNQGVKEYIAAGVADLLLRKGADHSIRARNRDMAIHYAVRQRNLQLVERLLRAGTSVYDQGAKGRTILHVAAKKGHIDVVKPLIKLGCDVNAVDAKGWTPLHHAAKGQHLEVLSVLLKHAGQEHGLVNEKRVNGGVVPMSTALDHGNIKVKQLLADAGIALHE